MEATRLSYSLNCLPSPRRSARSMSPLATNSQGTESRTPDRRAKVEETRPGLRLAPAEPCLHAPAGPALAALLAVALHLTTQVLGGLVNRVDHLRRGLVGPQGDPLQVKGGLRDLAVGDRGI